MGAWTLGSLALPWGCRPPASPGRRWSSTEALITALDGPHNYLPTPFHADYSVNLEGLRRNVAYHAERDRLTVVVGGGYGEGWKLSLEEHRELVAAAVAGAREQLPVMAGVIGGYQISIEMARNAEKAGADALVIFPPRGQHWQAESYYEFYKDIVTSVTIGAVVLPSGQHDFWPEVLIRLAKIPNMIGFFPPVGPDDDYYPRTGGQILEAVAKPLLFMAENEPAASDSFSRGSRAYSTAVVALVPEASTAFLEARSGRRDRQNGRSAENGVGPHSQDPRLQAGLRHQRHQGGHGGLGTGRGTCPSARHPGGCGRPGRNRRDSAEASRDPCPGRRGLRIVVSVDACGGCDGTGQKTGRGATRLPALKAGSNRSVIFFKLFQH